MDSFNPKLDVENATTNQSLLACSWDWPPATHNGSSGSPVPGAPVWHCHNTNNDGDGPEIDNPATPSTIAIVIPILYSLVCVVGLVGNVLVMYVIVRYTKMKTATNIYIFNLALADTLATSTLPFQIVNYFMSTWPFGRVLCKLIISIDYYNMFTSIFTLTMMSIDRYIAVCHPVRALDFRTPVKAKLVNICIWSLSSAIGLPVMIIAVTKQDKNGNVDCTLEFPIYWDNMLKTCVFVFAFFIPVCVITVCYGLMITRLRSVRVLSGSKEKDRTMRRITRMVLVVVAAFVVCWTPIHLYVIVRAIVRIPESAVVTVSWHVCIALGYVNSSMNPFLYAFLDENFKRCFREFCFRRNFRLDLPSTSRVRSIAREASSMNNLDGSNDNS